MLAPACDAQSQHEAVHGRAGNDQADTVMPACLGMHRPSTAARHELGASAHRCHTSTLTHDQQPPLRQLHSKQKSGVAVQDAVPRSGKFLVLFKLGGHRVVINRMGDLVVRPSPLEASLRQIPAGATSALRCRGFRVWSSGDTAEPSQVRSEPSGPCTATACCPSKRLLVLLADE